MGLLFLTKRCTLFSMSIRKLVVGFWLLIISLFVTPIAAFALSSTPSSLPSTVPYTLNTLPSSISPTSPIFTDMLVHNMFHTFSCLAIGSSIIGQPCLTYQITKNAQGVIQSVPMLSSVNLSGGTLGAVTSVIGMLYQHPPVRTADYLASVGQDLGIVKEAHAQVIGSGQAVLSPILALWQVSRNISYVIMILIFVIIGVMVMFRQKINPQAVITAQAAIPGLVIGLILITFSYFLAGLISDMAFVGTNIVGAYFSAVNGHVDQPQNLVNDVSSISVLTIFSHFVGIVNPEQTTSVLQQVYSSFTSDVQTTLGWFASLMAFQFVAPLGGLAGPYALIAGPIIGLITGAAIKIGTVAILGFFLQFIVVAVLIYAMLKLLLRLIHSYLTIIFLTITAPFQFLFASLPGRQGIATSWILNMLANILVFPAVLAVFYFIAFLLGQNFKPFTQVFSLNHQMNNTFTPTVYAAGKVNIVGTSTFPLFGGIDIQFIQILVAFGTLVALPAIPDIIVKAVGKAGQAGQILGQEIGGSIRSGQGHYMQSVNRASGGADTIGKGIFGEKQMSATGEIFTVRRGIIPPKVVTPLTPTPGAPTCLPSNTLIDTPYGSKTIKDIHKDDIVWTVNFNNKITQASVKQIIRRRVSKNHKMLQLVLTDGRELFVSPGHPNAIGKDLALFKKGDYLDRSYIIKRELLPYNHKYTYDILPGGETGAYFANNILIGSTLKIKMNKSLSAKFDFNAPPYL